MIVHIYSIMRDEEDILPYFLRYYSTFANKIFIIDDNSKDRTVKIARTNKKVRLLPYKFTEGYVEEEHNACFEYYYKKYSRGVADWVMVVDADEFIYHPALAERLKLLKMKGRKIIKATGYTMYSRSYPTTKGQIFEECNMGLRTPKYDKGVIFDPSIDVSFSAGRHHSFTTPEFDQSRAKILLLHFRHLSLVATIKPFCKIKKYKEWKLMKNIKYAIAMYEYGISELNKGKLIKVV